LGAIFVGLFVSSSVAWADGPLSPEEALGRFKVDEGLVIETVLAEPTITQPVFINFDEHGRLWVMEYRQYPAPAGLTLLSKDTFWRAVYDKVPAPPPNHVRGLDRISIHEDADGDGVFESHKVFVDGLNIATAFARGRGGVFVLNPPYLLFYPDRNDDDVPDGDPEVLLEGFGLEDTHSVVNSLRWGPDGWLYAAQGSTVTGHVKRPGSKESPVHSLGQHIWRYQPESKRYEIFAEGGGNAFGVEIDAKGRIYSGHNGGDTRGFHYVQGGYFRKGFDKHGPLSNPYAFGYFPAMKHPNVPRFTHTFLIYEAEDLPRFYQGRILGVAPLLNHVVLSERFPDGSTFRTRDIGHPIKTSDTWFRPVDIKLGPDGAVYVADWYDGQIAHTRNYEGKIDQSNGRVYRLRSDQTKPTRPVDLAKKSTPELIELLNNPNKFIRQTALRLIGDRKDASLAPRLAGMVERKTGQIALEALWALYQSGGLDEPRSLEFLAHHDPDVRLWTIRLLGDDGQVSSRLGRALIDRAADAADVLVRSQLACTAKRLPADVGLPIVANLLTHGEDARDPHLPLLLWWAVESKVDTDRPAVLALFRETAFWDRPVVREVIAERLMRRLAASGSRKDLIACAELLKLAPSSAHARRLMTGFEAALSGRTVAGLPDELAEALAKYQGEGGSVVLGLRQGKPEAVDQAIKTLGDERADKSRQLQYVQVLGEVDQPRAVPALLALASNPSDPGLQVAALSALARYADPAIPARVLQALPAMTEDVRTEALMLLAVRSGSAERLLEAVEAGKIDPRTIPSEVARRIMRHRVPTLDARARQLWSNLEPATPSALRAEIDRLASVVRSGPGDPLAGQRLFVKTCANCHTIFGQGGKVGPDLTSYRRDDLDAMLLGVVSPSAEIREGYGTYLIETKDGRALAGLLAEQDPQLVVLRNSDGREVSVRRSEIEEMTTSPVSLMPEGQLKSLADKDVRDLFAFLRSSQPPK
jgi:putative heme-binding domain-containing protein